MDHAELLPILRERILVCGDRRWTDRSAIQRELSKFDPAHTTIIHGNARGADRLAGMVAHELGFPVEVYPADWATYHKGAGPRRNQQMLDSGIDRVLAFHSDISTSRGTADMVARARGANIPATVFDR